MGVVIDKLLGPAFHTHSSADISGGPFLPLTGGVLSDSLGIGPTPIADAAFYVTLGSANMHIHSTTGEMETTGVINAFGGINVKDSLTTVYPNQVVFPQGASGDSSPGFRFVGGQTDGGLAMNDGILEFWNNFSQYTTPVGGHLQAVFRIDTRSGYEVEGFVIGGSLVSGTGFVSIGMNYNTGDVNLVYYGHGSVCVGTDVGSAGISGDGHLGVKYDIYAGRNIIANSAAGIKMGTSTTEKLGFWNSTPVVQSTGWTTSNVTTDKVLNANSTSVDELADVLCTLIEQLKTYGILGA